MHVTTSIYKNGLKQLQLYFPKFELYINSNYFKIIKIFILIEKLIQKSTWYAGEFFVNQFEQSPIQILLLELEFCYYEDELIW